MKRFIYLLLLFMPDTLMAADFQQGGVRDRQFDQQTYYRDPFTTSDKMYAQVGLQPGDRANVYGGFIPGYGASAQGAPKMRLKGYVTKNVSKATALLEIEGAGVFMVSKGDEIGLHAIGSTGVLKVVDVGPNGVRVQSGRLNQVILVK